MTVLIYTPSYKHIVKKYFFTGKKKKKKIMQFRQPLYDNLDDSPYPYSIPNFRFNFVKRCVIGLVKITYNRLTIFGCPKKLLGKKITEGLQQPPFGGRGLIYRI